MLNAPEARRPFGDSTNQNPALPDGLYPIGVGQLRAVPENQVLPERSVPSSTDDDDIIKKDYGLSKLYSLLHKVIQSTPAERLAVREGNFLGFEFINLKEISHGVSLLCDMEGRALVVGSELEIIFPCDFKKGPPPKLPT